MRYMAVFLLLVSVSGWCDSVWPKYFLECAELTDDDASCFSDFKNELVNYVQSKEQEAPTCTSAVAKRSGLLRTLKEQRDAFESLSQRAKDTYAFGIGSCLDKRMQQMAAIEKVVVRETGKKATENNPKGCAEASGLLSMLEMHMDSVIRHAQSCIGPER